jgi:hypothetical protein
MRFRADPGWGWEWLSEGNPYWGVFWDRLDLMFGLRIDRTGGRVTITLGFGLLSVFVNV